MGRYQIMPMTFNGFPVYRYSSVTKRVDSSAGIDPYYFGHAVRQRQIFAGTFFVRLPFSILAKEMRDYAFMAVWKRVAAF